jgi:NADPH:quinone reductase-like Zn-dependent oxidoreductase
MKAIQIPSHGGLEVLQSTTLPDPTPKAGEVLVRVKASAVDPLDGIAIRRTARMLITQDYCLPFSA